MSGASHRSTSSSQQCPLRQSRWENSPILSRTSVHRGSQGWTFLSRTFSQQCELRQSHDIFLDSYKDIPPAVCTDVSINEFSLLLHKDLLSRIYRGIHRIIFQLLQGHPQRRQSRENIIKSYQAVFAEVVIAEFFQLLQGYSLRQCSRRLSWEKCSISCKDLLPGNVHGDCLGRNSPFHARVFSPAMSTETVLGKVSISSRVFSPATSTDTVLGEILHFTQRSSPRQCPRAVLGEILHFMQEVFSRQCPLRTALGESFHFFQGSFSRQRSRTYHAPRRKAPFPQGLLPGVSRRLSWENSPFLAGVFSPAMSTETVLGGIPFLAESPPGNVHGGCYWEKVSISCKALLPGNVHGDCLGESSISCKISSPAMFTEAVIGKNLHFLQESSPWQCQGSSQGHFPFLARVFSSSAMSTEVVMGTFSISYKGLFFGSINGDMQSLEDFSNSTHPKQCSRRRSWENYCNSHKDVLPSRVNGGRYMGKFSNSYDNILSSGVNGGSQRKIPTRLSTEALVREFFPFLRRYSLCSGNVVCHAENYSHSNKNILSSNSHKGSLNSGVNLGQSWEMSHRMAASQAAKSCYKFPWSFMVSLPTGVNGGSCWRNSLHFRRTASLVVSTEAQMWQFPTNLPRTASAVAVSTATYNVMFT